MSDVIMNDSNRSDQSNPSTLKRLRELKEFQVADGYPDIRGWKVKTREGRRVGKVHDLIVSTAEMRARYLDVDLDDDDKHVLVPIGIAQLDTKHDDVLVHELTMADLAAYPRYEREGGIDRAYESAVWRHFSPDRDVTSSPGGSAGGSAGGTSAPLAATFGYDSHSYDDQRLFAGQRNRLPAPADDTAVRDASLEDTRGGVRHAGSMTTGAHEEVTIETRPITDATRTGEIQIGENEIRIPLMAEGVDGTRVPREEVIVRKRMVPGSPESAA